MSNMMRVLLLGLFLFFRLCLSAQTPYFQQEVHYQIEVALNDSLHQLAGTVNLTYIHKGPEPLNELYMHVWGNAFQHPNTAFGRQKARQGDTRFYFSDSEERGGYRELDFRLQGESLNWSLQVNDPDIAKIELSAPLPSGDSLQLEIPFVLQIPASFSRLGRVGQSYQLTQWYPKPAVYDRDGWHPMPYLDQGEFYSEFGSFDVEITLPKNYLVAATGTLETAAEKARLLELADSTLTLFESGTIPGSTDFPASSSALKTIRYTAENVHDFAWFADKRFHVLHNPFTLSTGEEVEAWAFFTEAEAELWREAPKYLERSTRFYSEAVGAYPYPQVTAVESALSAGAGMEYPMITVIGQSGNARALDEVITHEVGHNWFYGILASNERVHPWLDEGLNSYYEQRYMASYYPAEDLLAQLPEFFSKGSNLNDMSQAALLFQTRRRLDQAPATHSDSLSALNYGIAAYLTPALALHLAEAYLGVEAIDQGMKAYYETWKFRHPQPNDFRTLMEASLEQDLGWLFNELIGSSGGSDYALTSYTEGRRGMWNLTVKNRGGMALPYAIGAYLKNELVFTQWYTGHEGTLTRSFPAGKYDYWVLDPGEYLPERSRRQHVQGPKKSVSRTPQLKFLLGLENTKRSTIFWAPSIAWNKYDKVQLGLLLHNISVMERPFEYILSPMIATGNGKMTGLADLRYHIYPATSIVRRLTLSVSGRTAHYNYLAEHDTYLRFFRIQPQLEFDFRTNLMHGFQHRAGFRSTRIGETQGVFDRHGEFATTAYDFWNHEGYYEAFNRKAINPWLASGGLEQQVYTLPARNLEQQRFLRLRLEGQYAFTYKPKKRLYARGFLGLMLNSTSRQRGGVYPGAFNLTGQGHQSYNDYRYDEFYFGRNETEGLWAQQITIRDAGFKVPLPAAYRNVGGNTNNWMLAANFKADLPFPLPIRPYFDLAYISDKQPTGSGKDFYDQIWWSGGLCLELFENRFGIYVPLLQSANIKSLYDQAYAGGFWQRISFQFNLQNLHPDEFRNRIW